MVVQDCDLKDCVGKIFKVGDVVRKTAGEYEIHETYRVGFVFGSYCLAMGIERDGCEVPIPFVPLYYDEPEKLQIISEETNG